MRRNVLHRLPSSLYFRYVDTVPDDGRAVQCYDLESGVTSAASLAFPPDYFNIAGSASTGSVDVLLHADVVRKSTLELVCTGLPVAASIRMTNLPPGTPVP